MTEDIGRALTAGGLTRVRAGESMKRHTSWRVGGPADWFAVAETAEALKNAIGVARHYGIPWVVLGGGNNILVADAGIRGLVIANRMRGLSIEERSDESGPSPHALCAQAGVSFARAALFTAHHGFTGLEWAIAIPGTVGAGVVNNAGAHDGNIESALITAEAIRPDGSDLTLTRSDLHYRYRESALKDTVLHKHAIVITRCRFRIEPAPAAAALTRIESLLEQRNATQPINQPSAGSTFKNPEGGHAGAYIDRAGLKGHRIGGAEFSLRHANFIVNTGHATAVDIRALMSLAQQRVKDEFGVDLQPEIQFLGEWPDAEAEVLSSSDFPPEDKM